MELVLICLDQHISKLSDTVKGNSACHIAFQQQLPQDVYDVSSIMQLADKKEIFSQLPVGFAVVKLSERYTSPFLIKVPYTDLRNDTISDEKIKSKMDCVIQGIEVEKSDPEFREALVNPISPKIPAVMPVTSVTPVTEVELNIETPETTPEVTLEITPTSLTPTQEILYSFASEQLQKGRSLRAIEEILERGLSEKCYTSTDILKAINSLINSKLNKKELELNLEKDKIKEYPVLETLDNEEREFLIYLIENPLHTESTVELYKQMRLSTRKGNIIKNKLLDKDLIRIQEEKNDKGWKKFIRLTNNIHIH